MKRNHRTPGCVLTLSGLLACQSAFANDQNRFDFKATGIGLTVYSSKQDYSLTKLSFDNPALAAFAASKDQVVVKTDIEATSLKLDHQLRPYLNIFGSVVKTRGEALVKLSGIPTPPGVRLPDMTLDAGGTVYHLGATAIARKNDYILSLTYMHSLSKPNAGTEDGKANTLAPSVGKQTRFGVFSLGMVYQEAEGGLNGSFNIVPLGDVEVTVEAENTHKLSYNASYMTALAKDTFIRASAEFGDREGYHLGINHRF